MSLTESGADWKATDAADRSQVLEEIIRRAVERVALRCMRKRKGQSESLAPSLESTNTSIVKSFRLLKGLQLAISNILGLHCGAIQTPMR